MSTFYSRPLRSDELYHWKYKDKYKKGDHWVYIYDDGSTSETSSPKLVSTTTTDTMNQRETHNKIVSTNPKQLFTTKEKSTVGFRTPREKSSPGTWNRYGDDKRVVDAKTTTEKVTYGRLHMERMNLERKISEIPEKSIKTVKGLLSRFLGKEEDKPAPVPKSKQAIDKYKQAVRKNPLPKDHDVKEAEARETLKNKRQADADYSEKEKAAREMQWHQANSKRQYELNEEEAKRRRRQRR